MKHPMPWTFTFFGSVVAVAYFVIAIAYLIYDDALGFAVLWVCIHIGQMVIDQRYEDVS